MTKSLKVLATDDDAGIRAFLFTLLAEHGHHVEFARDGEEVFKLLGGQRYDLLILDVNMPGMNGYKVAEKLSANITNRPKILIFTGRNIEQEKFQFACSGADAILRKDEPGEKIVSAITGLFPDAPPPEEVRPGARAAGTQGETRTMPERTSAQAAPGAAQMEEELKNCLSRLARLEDLMNLKNLRYEEFIRDLLKEKQRTEKNHLEFKKVEAEVVKMKNWGYAIATMAVLALLRSLFG